ncbi:hypothetical protein I8J29_26510 [Paenibacillus sp. MWE-103]|uniref:AAA domain-containing protein n=1 Tax=Paenibacillus artemisiicola TaxID=1172618 RepID=A0ABS3WHH9_9BACL|nr:hypothetical protein [Paenibacillus artemisiicola]MBO7747747.1 hypothetical protein [Paenibacillus artemisiicola]
MSKRHLIVAVKEGEYVERFADYLRDSAFGESWQLTAFTNPAALRGFIRGGYAIDLLAAQPDMLGELGELPADLPVAALVEYLGQSRHGQEVLQFQPLPQLLQAFAALYAAGGNRLPKAVREGKEPSVVAVYSASGGTGKTTLAMQAAKQAGILGVPSFYLNLEQWNASWPADGGGGEDLAKLLYALQSDSGQAASAVAALRRRHPSLGLDMIAASDNPDERLSLGAEQAKRLIAAIAGTGEYGCIAVDLDCRLDALHAGVFEACDAVLWLMTPDAVSLRKNELALDYGERKFGDAFASQRPKFRFVQVGGSSREPAVYGGRNLRIDAVLPYVEEWASGGHLSGTGVMAPHYRGAVETLIRRLGIA